MKQQQRVNKKCQLFEFKILLMEKIMLETDFYRVTKDIKGAHLSKGEYYNYSKYINELTKKAEYKLYYDILLKHLNNLKKIKILQ